jgi:hypothetical protein
MERLIECPAGETGEQATTTGLGAGMFSASDNSHAKQQWRGGTTLIRFPGRKVRINDTRGVVQPLLVWSPVPEPRSLENCLLIEVIRGACVGWAASELPDDRGVKPEVRMGALGLSHPDRRQKMRKPLVRASAEAGCRDDGRTLTMPGGAYGVNRFAPQHRPSTQVLHHNYTGPRQPTS